MKCQNLFTAEWKSITHIKQKESHNYAPSETQFDFYMYYTLMQNSKLNNFLTSITHTNHIQIYCLQLLWRIYNNKNNKPSLSTKILGGYRSSKPKRDQPNVLLGRIYKEE